MNGKISDDKDSTWIVYAEDHIKRANINKLTSEASIRSTLASINMQCMFRLEISFNKITQSKRQIGRGRQEESEASACTHNCCSTIAAATGKKILITTLSRRMRGSSVILISAYWMLSMVKLYLELKPSIKCVRRCVCGLHMPVYLSVFFILSTFPFSTMLIIVCSSQNIFFFVSWPTFLLVIFVQC